MAAITWKNLHNSNLSDPVTGVTAAGNLINNAFGIANRTLSEAEANNGAAIERAREAQRNSVVQQLQSIGTPEQYAEMDKRGDIQAMFKGLDSRDQAALMGAPEARLDRLYQKQDIDRQRDLTTKAREVAPFIEAADLDIVNKNWAGAEQIAGGLPAKEQALVMRASTAAQAANLTNELNKRKLADSEAIRAMEQPLKIGALELQGQQHKDVVAVNSITSKMNAAAAAYKQTEVAKQRQLGALAKSKGFPTSLDGIPDVSTMRTNPKQLAEWENIAANSGITFGNDTQVADATMDNLLKSGVDAKHSGLIQSFRPLFNTRPTDLVGKEEDALTRGVAAITEAETKAKSTNSMFLTNENIIDRLKPFNESLKLKGLDEDKIAAINEVITEELTNSTGEPINLNALLQATSLSKEWGDSLLGREGSSDWWSFYKTDVRDRYNDVKKTPAFTNQLNEYLLHQGDNDKSRRELLKEKLRTTPVK